MALSSRRVLKAQARSAEALGDLIGAYWKPVYFAVRRGGASIEDSKDLTQGFFAAFLQRDFLKGEGAIPHVPPDGAGALPRQPGRAAPGEEA